MEKEDPVRRRQLDARWYPSAWRLRTKISVVLLLPVLVALVLSGARVRAELGQAGALTAVRDQVPVLQGIAELSSLVDRELVPDGNPVPGAAAAKAASVRHDAEFAQLAPETLRTLDAELDKLEALRSAPGTVVAETTAYQDIVFALSDVLPSVVAQAGDRELDAAANVAKSLIQLRATLATEEVLSRNSADDSARGAAQRAAAEETLLGNQIRQAIPAGPDLTRFAATTVGEPAAKNVALGTLLTDRVNALAASVEVQTNDARSDALRDTALVLGSLLGALAIALAVARSLVGPIHRLHTAALTTAHQVLPDTVERIRNGDDVDWRTLEPLPVDSDEEIGQLARAFDGMHQQAVRLAVGEQAELRVQVSEMFMTLSRRSQSLVELQLSVIEDLEADEQDPQRLGELFQIDHIATRLRRNGENLQVLAGGRPVRRDLGPVATVELLRAATSEVKDYQRITLGNAPYGSVQTQAAADVVHILAELLENAIRSSPPEEQVVLTADRGADGGVLIEVVDVGLGMDPADIEVANARLAAGATVSPETTRRMGLFVVGRLASPHGITIRLRQTTTRADRAGITASVHIPGELVLVDLPPRPRAAPEHNGSARRGHHEPEPQWPTEQPPPAPADQETGPLGLPAPTPIFEQTLSHWFADSPEGPPGRWTTPADEARAAAESAVRNSSDAQLTGSGLPTRRPGAQLAPGAASPRQESRSDSAFRDPVAVRNNLSRHYSGMRAARHRMANPPAEEPITETP